MLFIFDMGGVVTSTSNEFKQIAETLGMELSEFKKITDEDLHELSDGKISQKEFWKRFSDKTGKEVKTDWLHIYFHPAKKKGTFKLIEKLKSKGYRVVCGTNTIESHYMNHIERGDYDVFDQTYTSVALGVSKPDVDFWKIIMKVENVTGEEVVFIDDKKENCEAAASLGIKAIQFVSEEKLEEELKEYL